jgi:hypothetical protein
MEEQIQQQISQLLKQAIQKEILLPRQSLTYNGQEKPVNTKYQRPLPSPRSNTGELVNSVDVYFETDFEDGDANIVVDFGAADYWEFVNYGRRPSMKYPPLSIIETWAATKPVQRYRNDFGQFISNKSRAFLIARSIKEYGFYGINFLDTAYKNVERELIENASQLVLEYFTRKISNSRIVLRTDSNRPQ